MDKVNPDELSKLLRELNGLRDEAMWFLLILVMFGVLYLLVTKWLAERREQRLAEQKKERSQIYATSLDRLGDKVGALAEALNKHTDQEQVTTMQLNCTMSGVCETMSKVETAVRHLADKSAGVINRSDSIRMIRDRFVQNVFRDFCLIIETSLRENNFLANPESITRKVKTALGNVLLEARRYLGGYKLAVDPDPFFVARPDLNVERFVLCDTVWFHVEPICRRPHHDANLLREAIEEAFVIIENDIKDYVTVCCRGTDVQIDFRDASGGSAGESSASLHMSRTTRLLRTDAFPRSGTKPFEGGAGAGVTQA